MSEEGGSLTSEKAKLKRHGSTGNHRHPTAENDRSIKHVGSSSSVSPVRDRSMSMSFGEPGVSKRKSGGKPLQPFPEEERSPELVLLDDMTLRENYKASEKLFEVRFAEKFCFSVRIPFRSVFSLYSDFLYTGAALLDGKGDNRGYEKGKRS